MRYRKIVAAASAACFACSINVQAAEPTLEQVQAELDALKATYDSRIDQLEAKLQQKDGASETRNVYGNQYNPSIGIILNGRYQSFSSAASELPGFAMAEEAERGEEGFTVNHTEFNFSSNVDDVFSAGVNFAIAEHDGHSELELEEAYIRTLPDSGLPVGMEITVGRSLWVLGYLNEHHLHTDDFADRPLPYRVFLEQAFNDDGFQLSYLLPTELYMEIGTGVFRGNDFPFGGGHGSRFSAWSAYARVGGDIGHTQSWRAGISMLSGEAEERASNEELLNFSGDSQLLVADVRYIYDPASPSGAGELILQAEVFQRDEDGTYNDTSIGSGDIAFDDSSSGWYAQAVYSFSQRWRSGLRYSQLTPASAPAGLAGGVLDAQSHQPQSISWMVDWSNSEFSRLRLQLSRETLADNQDDTQFLLQYIVSLGAHGAHKF